MLTSELTDKEHSHRCLRGRRGRENKVDGEERENKRDRWMEKNEGGIEKERER